MPRLARLDGPGVLHHVIIRGIERRRKSYYEYVKEGISQGRRPELVGGGFIRSLGGWDVIKESGLKSIGRVKGDDRILGDGDFVLRVLKEADEKFDR